MIPILVALVPLLVAQAEKLFSVGHEKRTWVMDAMNDLEPLIKRLAPDWIDKNVDALESMIDLAIGFALDAMEK